MAIYPLQKVEDTGWRNVSDLLKPSWGPRGTGPAIRVRRIGRRVLVDLDAILVTAQAGTNVLFTPPTGFRTSTTAGSYATVDGFVINNLVDGTSVCVKGALPVGTTVRGQIDYDTNQPFPTVLPGTAA